MELREFFATHGEEENIVVARHAALEEWNKRLKFCSACGEPLPPINIDANKQQAINMRVCTSCGTQHFPRIEPCIIVVVQKEGKILLARHKQRNSNIYACIAGFVEAGESIEHAVRREVREEVGIEITNLQYRGSQSWPFPDQLMLGFTADYASGEITLQKEEILDAAFFPKDDLPPHPRPGSISYQLIHGLI